MAYKMYAAVIASLSAVTLLVAGNETFGGSGGMHAGGMAHPSHLQHHRRNHIGAFWPPAGLFYEPSNGETYNVTQPSNDIHYTYTYDVPWDAVHRYPPVVTPREPVFRPYVPGCPAQAVTVAGNDGKDQTVNIVRCY